MLEPSIAQVEGGFIALPQGCAVPQGQGGMLRTPESDDAVLLTSLTSCQHLALYDLTKHFEALLQFPRTHVTGEISNVYHTAFADGLFLPLPGMPGTWGSV